MTALKMSAGSQALERIEENGLTPDLVRTVIGASGGPKWLVLKGLDFFLFGKWLADTTHKIDLIGSSIGAWRMMLAAHPDAGQMFEKFLTGYFSYKTDGGLSPEEISRQSYDIIAELIPPGDMDAILENPYRNLNIVAVLCKGWSGSDKKIYEAAGLLGAAARNYIDRENLVQHFDRVNFHAHSTAANSDDWRDFNRTDVRLTRDNLADALMASGSVPFVIAPVKDIPGAPKGVYRDGGVIDYHFDIDWQLKEGIVLYPHFYGHVVPGWFDKSRKSRHKTQTVQTNTLMLYPSDAFVAGLPGGKIPERKNFTAMSDAERLKYWHIVVRESERLAEEFDTLLHNHGALMDQLR